MPWRPRWREGQLFAAQHPRETELAERLCGLLPGAEVVRFATSGTEAVLMAIRLARAFTGRDKILKFEGHYHGWSDQAYISARPPLNEAGPADAPVPVAGSPGMPASVLGDTVGLRLERSRAAGAGAGAHQGEIAAVIMEPMMVNGGAIRAGARLSRRRARLFAASTARCSSATRSSPASASGCAARRRKYGVTADLSDLRQGRRGGLPARAWSPAGATSWTRCSTRA